MDCSSHPVVSDEGDLTWSDSHSMTSMTSDEGIRGDALMQHSPSPHEVETWLNPTTTSRLQTGQLSPVSTGMEMPALDGSSAPTMIHSASSSCTDSWSIGYGERDEADRDMHWEQGSDDVLTAPKLEPLDDDFNLDDLKEAPLSPAQDGGPTSSPTIAPKQKRPRGRPRKHPLTAAVATNKVTKGRSKTGCITCRKRKKKCDEAKPRCMNCEKNAVVCEGYHEKQIWRSGKEKAEEDVDRRLDSLPVITMPAIFHAVETPEDKIFWRHYCVSLSNVLTVEGEHKNAFKDIILNLANQHQGLMHSILAVSSKHIDYNTPYGIKLLQDNPTTSLDSLQQRADFHHEAAMKRFYEDIERSSDLDDPERRTILSARYGQMMCLLIGTLAEGNPRGEHRYHLEAYKRLIHESPPEDPSFLMFITEFFQYHIYADELIWHPDMHIRRLASEDWQPPVAIHPPRLLGVADKLFGYLTSITSIRNTIRANISAGVDPVVDYSCLYRAAEIDAGIRDWEPDWPKGDSRQKVGLLYKQMMWVYLFRSIYPPSGSRYTSMVNSHAASHNTSHAATSPRHSISEHGPSGNSSPVHASVGGGSGRPSSSSSSAATTHPSAGPSSASSNNAGSRAPSRTNSMHESSLGGLEGVHNVISAVPVIPVVPPLSPTHTPQQPSSPRPFRRPPNHDNRVDEPVDRALAILESFNISEPANTLLLIPCLVIGTACFDPQQQDRIRNAVKQVRGYTGLRNCDRVQELLDEIWRLMDLGDWLAVWDWQGVARRRGLDFLCT